MARRRPVDPDRLAQAAGVDPAALRQAIRRHKGDEVAALGDLGVGYAAAEAAVLAARKPAKPLPRTPRSVERWDSLSANSRRRWRTAFGSERKARNAYVRGEHLTAAQRGHGGTPSSPLQALLHPERYPEYVGRHTDELNELARQRGMGKRGTGPRGPQVTKGKPFTYVVSAQEFATRRRPGDWHLYRSFRTRGEAQLWARQSRAPAGVVLIVDNGPDWKDKRTRYGVWFSDISPQAKRKKSRN